MNKILNGVLGIISLLLVLGAYGSMSWIVWGEYWERYELVLVFLAIALLIGLGLGIYTSHDYVKYHTKERWAWILPSFHRFIMLALAFAVFAYGMIGPPWRGFELYYVLVGSFLVSFFVIILRDTVPLEEAENEAEMEDDLENKPESRG